MIRLLAVVLCVSHVMADVPRPPNINTADCGKQNITTVTIQGKKVQDGEHPWNINVYAGANNAWVYRCAGTLLSSRHVITTTSCGVNKEKQPYVASALKLAGRKHSQDFSLVEPNAQLRDVKTIVRHEQANLVTGEHDIMLLVAEQNFLLSPALNVACLDWPGLLQLSSDLLISAAVRKVPQAAGRRLLMSQRYSYIPDRANCTASVGKDVLPRYSVDKFCARVNTNESCEGIAGAGLLLRQKMPGGARYNLMGVNSFTLSAGGTSATCYTNRVDAFVSVKEHLPWIRTHLTR